MTMIEKIEDAIFEAIEYAVPPEMCRTAARAALEAMRDWPSVELRIDGIAGAPIGSGYGRRFWNAAIDSALRTDSDLNEMNKPEQVG